jgi:hypothetical protein
MHLSFTDDPSYLSTLGRDLVGTRLGIGSTSLADMTSMTGDAIAAFVGPALGVTGGRTVGEVVASHPGIARESTAVSLNAAAALPG